VDPAWQGRQVGARLCDHVIQEAKRLGATTLILHTNDRLETAMNLYLSRGWVIEKTGAIDPRYGRSNVLMRLDLD
jgi:GNAT superfamily N-acetyltransferase